MSGTAGDPRSDIHRLNSTTVGPSDIGTMTPSTDAVREAAQRLLDEWEASEDGLVPRGLWMALRDALAAPRVGEGELTGAGVQAAVFSVCHEDMRDGPDSWTDDDWNAIARALSSETPAQQEEGTT